MAVLCCYCVVPGCLISIKNRFTVFQNVLILYADENTSRLESRSFAKKVNTESFQRKLSTLRADMRWLFLRLMKF